MVYFHWIAGTILALAWFSRIVDAALGMPSVADVSRPEWDRNPVSPAGNPRVSIIVPARNEEETIEQALNTLLALDYDNYEVIAVNDRSTDRTGEIMERIAEHSLPSTSPGQAFSQKARETGHPDFRSFQVVHHRELPPGWLGKTHAMWTAANRASGDWLLFTDADVIFKPDSLRRAVAYAESVSADHVVLVSADDHEEARRVHDDRFLSDHVHVWAPALESCRPQHGRSHGGRRIQPGAPPRIRCSRDV